jgi:hypothetical protein
MDLNDYLGLLAEVDGATSISTISLVDIEVDSFPPYIYIPTPWAKHTKITVRGAPSLKNLSCSKLDYSPLLETLSLANPFLVCGFIAMVVRP